MRQAERDCTRLGISAAGLMENAGKAVAEEIRRILGQVEQKPILFLIGPGNNGGDGLVAARHLYDWGAYPGVYLLAERPSDDSNLEQIRSRGLTLINASEDISHGSLNDWLSRSVAVVDAVFGTGKVRPLEDVLAKILSEVMAAKQRRLAMQLIAVDLPSGLDGDTGHTDPASLFADNTITLGFPKPGLFLAPGAERAGKISVVSIGIPESLVDSIPDEMITQERVRSLLPKRPLAANKGTFGRLLVVAGSVNYVGAAYLACSGAMRAGAGLVAAAAPASLYPILGSKLTEVTHVPLAETPPGYISSRAAVSARRELKNSRALLVGCGLGQNPSVTRFVKSFLLTKDIPVPAVIDADALNALAGIPDWSIKLSGEVIMTPHPGEMARLTGLSVDTIQSDRINLAKQKAREWQKTVVLKGAYTVLAAVDGRCMVAPFANPGLASAGTGDILAGVIAALLVQGLPAFEAAALGVYLHGSAGERVKDRLGDTGMVASDLLTELPLAIKQLKQL